MFITKETFKKAEKQYELLIKESNLTNKFHRTVKEGKLIVTNEWDWTGGFFPGSLWLIYNQTGSEKIKNEAQQK